MLGLVGRAGVAAGAVTVAMLAGWAPAHASTTTPPTSASTAVTPSPSVKSSRSSTQPTGGTTSGSATTGSVTTGSGGGTVTAGATATPGAGGEATLSPAELAAQIAQADALTRDLTASNAGIAAAATKLDRLALEANTLLQEYAAARDAERTAREEANRNVLLYQQLSTRLGEDRRALGQWAYLAYAGTGGTISDMGTLLDTLAKSASEASDTAAQLSYLTDQRTGQIQRVQNQTQLQRTIAIKAVEASTRATEAATQAAEAKKKLDVVVQEQKAQLDATRQLHATQVAKAGPVAGLLLGSGDAAAMEASKRLRAALVVPGVLADGSVEACSTNETEYPNGKIPVAGPLPPLRCRRPEPASRGCGRVQRDEHRLPEGHGLPDLRHRLLPFLCRPGRSQGRQGQVGSHPRTQRARHGPRRGPLWWHQQLRYPGPPVDEAERTAVRVVPPGLGRAHRLAARAVALGVSRLVPAIAGSPTPGPAVPTRHAVWVGIPICVATRCATLHA